MKRINIIGLLLVGSFISCDDRLETLEALNSAPKVQYYNTSNNLVDNITDSVRLMPLGVTVYNLKLKITDLNKNVQFLNLTDTKGDYKIYYQKNEIKAPASFRTDVDNLVLNIYPTKLGNVQASFKITDRFGLSSVSNVNLLVFDNFKPIAVLITKKIQGNTYALDASKSYDEDKNFDGKIVRYLFKINGKDYETETPILNQVLVPGENTIQLRVMDNSNALSDLVEQKVINQN